MQGHAVRHCGSLRCAPNGGEVPCVPTVETILHKRRVSIAAEGEQPPRGPR